MSDLRVEVISAAADLPSAWARHVAGPSVVLQPAFLDAMAAAPPKGSLHRFALGWRGQRLVAAAAFHAVPLTAGALGQAEADASWAVRAFFRMAGWLHRGRPHMLVCGHMAHTDASGLACAADEPEPAGLLHQLTEAARLSLGVPVALVVLKQPDLAASHHRLVPLGYHPVHSAQPTMRLPIERSWDTFDAYLDALRSKYRQRARSARKRGRALRRQPLDAAAISHHADALDGLLAPVLARADVVVAPVEAATLAALKQAWGDALRVVLYREADRPVAYAVSLAHGDRVEGMLVGLDDARNAPLKLYQNVLYDFVERAVDEGAAWLDLGRTALEIKSAMGAEPHRFPVYVRHPGWLLHRALGFATRRMQAPTWTRRHPFHAAPEPDAR